MAPARRGRVAPVGGALRRARLRAAWPVRPGRSAEAGRSRRAPARAPPRAPDPPPPEAPPARRGGAGRLASGGALCRAWGTRPRPPQRGGVRGRAVDRRAPERLAGVPATIATFTVDRLAFSPSP